jgi:thioredoxin reductase (NADPH)
MPEKLVILGSGPAGWTAAIYAARAELDPLLYEGDATQYVIPGGQLMFTTEIENFPGFPETLDGPELMQRMRAQAERFGVRVLSADITQIDTGSRPFLLKDTEGNEFRAHGVIIATGAVPCWLGLENEQRLARSCGGGVSVCAICDGSLPIFRDKVLAVVGGGDCAMEEATYLTNYASRVHIIHQFGELQASKIEQERALSNPKIDVMWHKNVVDILGDERISALVLKDSITNEKSTFPVGGLFVCIGHRPNTDFLKGVVDLDDKGYIIMPTPFQTNTSVEGIFAAGDAMDFRYRQAITAAGTGCMAAIDAQRWLASQGITGRDNVSEFLGNNIASG